MRPMIGCALLLGTLATSACMTMKAVPMNELVALKPNRVWVTQTDESVVLVTGPINVLGDTLVGYVAGTYAEMPASTLKQFVVKEPATTRTVLLVSTIAVGLGGFIYAIAGNAGGSAPPNALAGDCDKIPDAPGCPGTM
jgi:hypothetical protein